MGDVQHIPSSKKGEGGWKQLWQSSEFLGFLCVPLLPLAPLALKALMEPLWSPYGALWSPYGALMEPYGTLWSPYGALQPFFRKIKESTKTKTTLPTGATAI